ncbi:MAG TPA: HD domain-containing protein, partial [Alphaproteobacteria bacterium]|nr:HD domain-containing protein [Alphaproteobacteria bacterium]
VWTHTLLVLDAAAGLRRGDGDDFALMLGALCHDLGKPATTERSDEEDGMRIRSPAHDRAGIAPTRALLERLRASNALVTAVCALVEHHLAPALFVRQGAGPRAYRRLARKLEAAGVSIDLLVRVARADHLGRTTDEALAGSFPAGDAFLAASAALDISRHGPQDVVLGRHVLARGVPPGPGVGRILEACRGVQDETGETDPDRILDAVLAGDGPSDPRP